MSMLRTTTSTPRERRPAAALVAGLSPKPLFSAGDAAAYLGVSASTRQQIEQEVGPIRKEL